MVSYVCMKRFWIWIQLINSKNCTLCFKFTLIKLVYIHLLYRNQYLPLTPYGRFKVEKVGKNYAAICNSKKCFIWFYFPWGRDCILSYPENINNWGNATQIIESWYKKTYNAFAFVISKVNLLLVQVSKKSNACFSV